MVSVNDVERATGAIEAVLNRIVRGVQYVQRAGFRLKVDQLLESLRNIYFFDSGVLSVLDQIADGRTANPEWVRRFAKEFRETPPTVQQALMNLSADANLGQLDLPIMVLDAMDSIGNGKMRIRQEVGLFLWEYQKNPAGRHASTAALLVNNIRQINARVNDVEQRLNSAKSS